MKKNIFVCIVLICSIWICSCGCSGSNLTTRLSSEDFLTSATIPRQNPLGLEGTSNCIYAIDTLSKNYFEVTGIDFKYLNELLSSLSWTDGQIKIDPMFMLVLPNDLEIRYDTEGIFYDYFYKRYVRLSEEETQSVNTILAKFFVM